MAEVQTDDAQGAPAPAAEINAAIACLYCGYNLLGLKTDANCPECGRPVAASLSMSDQMSPQRLLAASRTLARTLLWGMCELACGIFLLANVSSLSARSGSAQIAAFVVAFCGAVAAAWLRAAAVWRLTSRGVFPGDLGIIAEMQVARGFVTVHAGCLSALGLSMLLVLAGIGAAEFLTAAFALVTLLTGFLGGLTVLDLAQTLTRRTQSPAYLKRFHFRVSTMVVVFFGTCIFYGLGVVLAWLLYQWTVWQLVRDLRRRAHGDLIP